MIKPKTTKSANNIMWVEYWIRKAHPSYAEFNIEAAKYDSYRWICEIELPLINTTVKSICESEINSMCNAAKKAAHLIEQYMNKHSQLKFENPYKNGHWIINGDEKGNFLSLHQNIIGNKKRANEFRKETTSSINQVKKAINSIGDILGSRNNLFIQVIDQSLFNETQTIEEILEIVSSNIEKEYQTTRLSVYYDREGNSIIAVGYTQPKPKEGVNENEIPIL